MGIKENEYLLQFDFKMNNQMAPIQFTNPEEIITANHLHEVDDCIKRIDQVTQEGKYVAGYISYEVTYAFQNDYTKPLNNKIPLLWFGVFSKQSNVTGLDKGNFTINDWKMKETKSAYMKNFQQIMNEMELGNFEQINYTVPFQAKFIGNPFAYYLQLKQAQRAKYNAFLQIKNFSILSASPELFFHLHNRKITVKPMKGTIHRGKTYNEDLNNKNWLKSSEKNKLENELISNLMVNELKEIADPTSITISNQFEVEQYPTVFQMTSTINGEMMLDKKITDILKGLFPCGSISGTPKKAAIDYITQIENEPREVYCGAIGYITPKNEAIFNVPIRTVLIDYENELATYHAGGAITLQSDPHEEYEEMITKTKILHLKYEPFQLVETLGLHNGEYTVFHAHLHRLQQSASYFNYKIPLAEIKIALTNLAKENPAGSWIVRLLVEESGKFNISISPLIQTEKTVFVLAKEPINKENIFFYHKTTNRSIYEQHKIDDKNIFDVLLWNENEEITEFTIGNIVVEIDGELYTPPVECGLLPGTFREKLLNDGEIAEAKIFKSDLKKCTRIWLINSVRHWVEVTQHTGN